jgi:cytochrome c oxidase assembly protein subunit 15
MANFTRFSCGVVGCNLFVILWGAYVRASGSGNGCGSHWPLCNGEVVPLAPRVQTIIEFTHRVSSGVAFFAVAGLLGWSVRRFPRGHRARLTALASFAFMLVEVALGAGLVLLQYVAGNASVGRAFYLSMHLVSTQGLLAMLVLTAWFSRDAPQSPGRLSWPALASLPIAVVVSVTGVIAALGDTLYPAASLAAGVQQDFSSTAHFLVRLRVLHPVLAVLAAAYFATVSIRLLRSTLRPPAARMAWFVLVMAMAQLCAGVINLTLLAPAWMQLTHLLLADLVWISLVLLAVEAPDQNE